MHSTNSSRENGHLLWAWRDWHEERITLCPMSAIRLGLLPSSLACPVYALRSTWTSLSTWHNGLFLTMQIQQGLYGWAQAACSVEVKQGGVMLLLLLLPAHWTMDTRKLGAQPTFSVLAVLWNTHGMSGSSWSCAWGGSEPGAHSSSCLVEVTLARETWALCITDTERGRSVLLH